MSEEKVSPGLKFGMLLRKVCSATAKGTVVACKATAEFAKSAKEIKDGWTIQGKLDKAAQEGKE